MGWIKRGQSRSWKDKVDKDIERRNLQEYDWKDKNRCGCYR